jgi:hypothetical protein
MTAGDTTPLVGLVRLRDHCTFKWQRSDGSDQRTVVVLDHHCLQCLAEARRRGYNLITQHGTAYSG